MHDPHRSLRAWSLLLLLFCGSSASTSLAQTLAQGEGTRNIRVLDHLETPAPSRSIHLAASGTFYVLGDDQSLRSLSVEGTQVTSTVRTIPAQIDASRRVVTTVTRADGEHVFVAAERDALPVLWHQPPSGRARWINLPQSTQSVFAYHHTQAGALLLLGTDDGVYVYSVDALVATTKPEPRDLLEAPPTMRGPRGVVDVYAQYDEARGEDRLYTTGPEEAVIYDISDLSAISRIGGIRSAAIQTAPFIRPTSDGDYILVSGGYRMAPLRIFDMRPVWDGSLSEARTATGAWIPSPYGDVRRFTVRWPYVLMAGLHDGFFVVNMRRPSEPFVAGAFQTYAGDRPALADRARDLEGAFDVAFRNDDGAIVVTDPTAGIFVLRMEDLRMWDGRRWGTSPMNEVQRWDAPPATY